MPDCLQEDIQNIGVLPDEDCWQILSSIAFFGRREPERAKLWDTGKCIASTCDGLPLAARVLGILLRFKSYNELCPPLRHCFSYCGIFPKDSYILVYTLIQCWMALGYLSLSSDRGDGSMELKGREYFNSLTMLSFFQVEEADGKVHMVERGKLPRGKKEDKY
ncbi:hypothetical protein MIMGU_mgv1a015283mg [Erythranthe guttata]|uniref:Disease resistance protein winged helix domain-containing protein n=1 Tax=Erythranthe guttata TaxID=4155 RepID=A0A022PVF0_ERYGU|nr:hypothetical protein MIMGU_mgv1a015283mg [Erythranthe guttata]